MCWTVTSETFVHKVVVEKPYVFVPPYKGKFWPTVLRGVARRRLKRKFGVVQVDCRGLEHLATSRKAGHGILLAPNHCRPSDPFVIGEMARQANILPHTMASSHLFANGRVQTWLLRRGGVFSVYREGMDRQAIGAAMEILESADRPLVIFPEGVITRTNDRLNALMDGTAFIARGAAKKRAQASPAGQVVIHPVALKYFFRGDIEAAVGPALDDIECRLSWRPQRGLSLAQRIAKLGAALLALKEVEHLGEPQQGTVAARIERLINHLLVPLEQEWTGGKTDPTVVGRVKKLRTAVLPDMIEGKVTPEERDRRWRQLSDMYLAQQLSCYPPDYLASAPTPERMLETVERFEEDLTDECRIYRPMTVSVQVGEAIPVSPTRDRSAAEDPAMSALDKQLHDMIAGMK
jgi:1-acyl-sn-glycerol-3-phosphate acyltransferase